MLIGEGIKSDILILFGCFFVNWSECTDLGEQEACIVETKDLWIIPVKLTYDYHKVDSFSISNALVVNF